MIKEELQRLAPKDSDNRITPPRFDHIGLTPEETDEALRIARETKHNSIEREKYFKRIKESPVVPMYDPKLAYAALRKSKNAKGEFFLIDQDNAEVVKLLCLYFSGDKRFETEYTDKGYLLNKGICLMGPVGVGKSHLMQFFMMNKHQSYIIPSCIDIENKWVNEGRKEPYTINDVGIIDHYSTIIKAPISDPFLHSVTGICFEDLGTRENPLQKRFGEEKNVMMEIILNRYSRGIPFNQTHFTTNLDADGIESKYGTRVRDRIREMCNVIALTGKSRRT